LDVHDIFDMVFMVTTYIKYFTYSFESQTSKKRNYSDNIRTWLLLQKRKACSIVGYCPTGLFATVPAQRKCDVATFCSYL